MIELIKSNPDKFVPGSIEIKDGYQIFKRYHERYHGNIRRVRRIA